MRQPDFAETGWWVVGLGGFELFKATAAHTTSDANCAGWVELGDKWGCTGVR